MSAVQALLDHYLDLRFFTGNAAYFAHVRSGLHRERVVNRVAVCVFISLRERCRNAVCRLGIGRAEVVGSSFSDYECRALAVVARTVSGAPCEECDAERECSERTNAHRHFPFSALMEGSLVSASAVRPISTS